MLTSAPKLSIAEVREILRDLAQRGMVIPEPSKVEVVADEDFDGDPVFRLRLVFPADIPAESASWKLLRPLLARLTALVSERSGYERPVLDELIRLSETEQEA